MNNPFTIIGFGDSLTYGYGVLEETAYPYRLSKDLPFLYSEIKWNIINSGINGHTSEDAVNRLPMSVLHRKPQIVFILFGSNDSAFHEGQYCTPAAYEKNMQYILERILSCKTGHPFQNGRPLPVLLTPPSMVDTDFYPFTTNDRLALYGDVVKKLAEKYQLPCIDLFAAYQSIKKEDDYEACFQFDGIHLSNRGYEVLYDLILQKTKEIIEPYAESLQKA